MSQPAYTTKHLPFLPHSSFLLAQSDDGRSSGTALWPAGQVLAAYLAHHLKAEQQPRPRAVELGSGVGLTALALGALGYDVLATDTRHVCDCVLRRNIAANHASTRIQVRELDWNVHSDCWSWSDPVRITDSDNTLNMHAPDLLRPPFDLILSSDTLYEPLLVQPFFRTVQALAAASRPTSPRLFLALERRDPTLIDEALACAPARLSRVPVRKIRRALERAGMHWDSSEWEGVEIWSGRV